MAYKNQKKQKKHVRGLHKIKKTKKRIAKKDKAYKDLVKAFMPKYDD
jgi:hypothetical protein